MYDLHLHLDGSVSPAFLLEQARKDAVPLPADTEDALLPRLRVNPGCRDLNEYLEKFDLPLSVLQTEDALENCVYDLISRLASQGLSGVEIRFAPQLHLKKGLSMEAVTEAAISGLEKGQRDFPLKSGLILCCMRTDPSSGTNLEKNMETVQLAKRYRNQHVLALDLAGAEALYPTGLFEPVFREAARSDIPFTIHAGEAAGAESIRAALNFGACRIGHGVRCIEDPGLVELLIKKQIPLEICPTSNLQTRAVENISEHPVLTLLDAGMCITVNTDNMTVSGTTLENEFHLLSSSLHLTGAQRDQLDKNAKKASFL